MDTAREKDINLGADYPFDPLGAGECVVPDRYESSLGLTVGETVKINYEMSQVLQTLARRYNNEEHPKHKAP